MNQHTSPRKRGAITVAAMTGAAAVALAAPGAQANVSGNQHSGYGAVSQRVAVRTLATNEHLSKAEATRLINAQHVSIALSDRLLGQLGDQAASSFIDPKTGALTVNVLSESAAAKVRAAGATAKLVKHSYAHLVDIENALPHVVNTAWSIDPRSNAVVVTVSDHADGAAAKQLIATAQSYGDAVRVKHTSSTFRPAIASGQAIQGSSARCSVGFAASDSQIVVDAGHCTADVQQWDIGNSIDSHFPGTDYGTIQNTSGGTYTGVDTYGGAAQAITQAAQATTGEQVCKSGSTSQVTCGSVNGLNASVTYQEGTVSGLIDTNVCAQPGDSGGALYDGTKALGITSGGDTSCNGASIYFYPVVDALSAENLTLTPSSGGDNGGGNN
jgi:streptogrisin D